jgi:hypothetical protein
MNPPILVLSVLAFGFANLLAPTFKQIEEKEMQKREASTKAYDKWVSQQNLIQEQYQQEKEMLATGSVGSIPEKSVKWLKYICDCNKGQFNAKQDPSWGDGYFILYCKGVTK